MHGRQLTLVGDDLDRRMSRFESSQGFNLADVDVATIDPRGRASVRQAMHGSFVHPVLEKPRPSSGATTKPCTPGVSAISPLT